MNLSRVTLVVLVLCSIVHADSMELTVVPSSRAPFNATQDWARSLASLRSVRVRAGGGREPARPAVKRNGNTVLVTGVIDSNNKLLVPGKSFSIRQTALLQSWLDEQRESDNKTTAEPANDRFGLTSALLKSTHESLKATVSDFTKGKVVQEVVQAISRRTGLRLQLSSAARRIMGNKKVADEWQGFSSGTAMAAVLRPLELVMVPKANGNQIQLHVEIEESVGEPWPVGWKSKLNQKKLVPKIYDSLPIDVEETPIADVMAALESRLELPMRYDTATLSLKQIDPSQKTVTYAASRTNYVRAINFMLQKARLKHEIRVDERGKPFMWIMPRGLPSSR